MEKNKKRSVYILNIDEQGRKVWTSQSDNTKKFILDEDGAFTEFNSELLNPASVKMEFDCELPTSSPVSNDAILETDSDYAVTHLGDATGLDIMSQLEHVPSMDDALIPELNIASGSNQNSNDENSMLVEKIDISDEDDYTMMQYMDIRQPLSTLKTLLEERLGIELPGYEFWLQNMQMLEDHRNLVDQCVQGEGLVQVNVQIQTHDKRINIIDVLKPADDIVETTLPEVLNDKIDLAGTHFIHSTDMQEDTQTTSEISETEDKNQSVIRWQIDAQFRNDQDRLRIPKDPHQWSSKQVSHWLQWAVRHFKLAHIKLAEWNITGEELCNMTLPEFQKRVRNDTDDIFWTHLELLRKCHFVAVVQKDADSTADVETKRMPRIIKPLRPRYVPTDLQNVRVVESPTTYTVNRTGNNGQIQLWQFLLDLLTSREHRHMIQWIDGTDGEFKLIRPELVARLWGDRKNKPTMNYEKLSRALRYYYDGDMIAKVYGKRFVYKFICDLKQLLGYSAQELARLVEES